MISFEAIRHPKYKYRLTHAYNHALENFQADDRCALRQDDLTWIQLYQGGLFHVARGYCWDGASGPALDTMNFARASLVHDAIYQLIAAGLGSSLERGCRRGSGDTCTSGDGSPRS